MFAFNAVIICERDCRVHLSGLGHRKVRVMQGLSWLLSSKSASKVDDAMQCVLRIILQHLQYVRSVSRSSMKSLALCLRVLICRLRLHLQPIFDLCKVLSLLEGDARHHKKVGVAFGCIATRAERSETNVVPIFVSIGYCRTLDRAPE